MEAARSASAAQQRLFRVREAVSTLLHNTKSERFIPDNVKILVFDLEVLLRDVLEALHEHGYSYALIWNSSVQQHIRVFTPRDVSGIMRMYLTRYPNGQLPERLDDLRLRDWVETVDGEAGAGDEGAAGGALSAHMVTVSPLQSALDAAKLLLDHDTVRLPITDPETNAVVHMITFSKIIRSLRFSLAGMPELLNLTIEELDVGQTDVSSLSETASVAAVLKMFAESPEIGCIPLLDNDGIVVEIVVRSDLVALGMDQKYRDLNATIRSVLEYSRYRQGLVTCRQGDTIDSVFASVLGANGAVHYLVIVDDEGHLRGTTGLSDIFAAFLKTSRENEEEAASS